VKIFILCSWGINYGLMTLMSRMLMLCWSCYCCGGNIFIFTVFCSKNL